MPELDVAARHARGSLARRAALAAVGVGALVGATLTAFPGGSFGAPMFLLAAISAAASLTLAWFVVEVMLAKARGGIAPFMLLAWWSTIGLVAGIAAVEIEESIAVHRARAEGDAWLEAAESVRLRDGGYPASDATGWHPEPGFAARRFGLRYERRPDGAGVVHFMAPGAFFPAVHARVTGEPRWSED